jgi:MFS family permease
MIIDIVKSNFKIIIFGFVFTFFSCIGQSFFIGLFNSNIRDELNITHGEFGTIYGIATLCSSLTLIWLGKKIDDLKLINYSLLVVTFLSLAALFFSFVNGLIFLAIGIFFLRLSGQGLMTHTASVAIIRFFERSRGKALSYTWIGMSFGEFFLPVIIVYFLTFIYWRSLWQGFAIIIILLLPIFTYLTIKEINIFSRENKTENNVKKILIQLKAGPEKKC